MTGAARVAFVTGANRGLGLETSRQLVVRGYRVLLGSRDPDAGSAAAAAIGGAGNRVVRLDVTSERDVADCQALIERELGQLDVLINNAAVHYDSDQTANYLNGLRARLNDLFPQGHPLVKRHAADTQSSV